MGINNRGLLKGRVQDFYKAKQNCYDFVLIVCLKIQSHQHRENYYDQFGTQIIRLREELIRIVGRQTQQPERSTQQLPHHACAHARTFV